MASNLVRKGFRLVVTDLNRDAVQELENLQARGAADAAEVARQSDIVVTMLPNSAVVQDVATRADGILANLKPGAILMDMSTVSPETSDALAAAAQARGIGFVDAPVGRLASHADRGESLFMVGGTDADFARVKPLLDGMGSTVSIAGRPGRARAPSS
jgi:4-hydroxybutyrate dehydrogenase / sulfolactaldehyde 3-reductase